jgi:hypothetical protein
MERWRYTLFSIGMIGSLFGFGLGISTESVLWILAGILGFCGMLVAVMMPTA